MARHEVPVRGEGRTPSTPKVLRVASAMLWFDMRPACGVRHCSREVSTVEYGVRPKGMRLQFYIVRDRKRVAKG